MVAKLYSINLDDKTKLSLLSSNLRVRACGDLTDRFDWQASFLYFSLIFFIRTSTKANFYLAPPPSPASPSSFVPIDLLQLNRYFYLDTQHEMKTQTKDRHCAVRARERNFQVSVEGYSRFPWVCFLVLAADLPCFKVFKILLSFTFLFVSQLPRLVISLLFYSMNFGRNFDAQLNVLTFLGTDLIAALICPSFFDNIVSFAV